VRDEPLEANVQLDGPIFANFFHHEDAKREFLMGCTASGSSAPESGRRLRPEPIPPIGRPGRSHGPFAMLPANGIPSCGLWSSTCRVPFPWPTR